MIKYSQPELIPSANTGYYLCGHFMFSDRSGVCPEYSAGSAAKSAAGTRIVNALRNIKTNTK
jgi:hypothetical protein